MMPVTRDDCFLSHVLEDFTWRRSHPFPPIRLKVDDATISGNYLCLRNASMLVPILV